MKIKIILITFIITLFNITVSADSNTNVSHFIKAGLLAGRFSARDSGEAYVPAIMYHLISEDSSEWSDYCVSPAQLENDFILIKQLGFETIFAGEYNGETKVKRPLIITFDDGYLSCLDYVKPLIEKYQIKASFYVIGSFIESGEYGYLNENQLKELSDSEYAEIGNHSYSIHLKSNRDVSKLSGNANKIYEIAEDYKKNGILIEKITEKPVNTLSFPYGILPSKVDVLQGELGYANAFTSNKGINASGAKKWALSRYNRPSYQNSKEFFGVLIRDLKMSIPYSRWERDYSDVIIK
jgi:peptidoglycan/xylan/chitin deacetylase (PgdA/CDA1 family)